MVEVLNILFEKKILNLNLTVKKLKMFLVKRKALN